MSSFFSNPIESPLKAIAGVWKFERKNMLGSKARSTPGHLFHFIKKGKLTIKVNDGKYKLEAGDIFHYFDSEEVTNFSKKEVVFYSVSFQAPALPPPSPETRKITPDRNLEKEFEVLYEASLMPESSLKSFTAHSCLSRIILEINLKTQWLKQKTNGKWEEIESKARKQKKFRTTLHELAKLGNVSKPGLVRLCRKATGKSPMQRIREIRMAESKSLLMHTQMNISQTAEYLGYSRIHEFSREFSKFFGHPPTQIKKKFL